MRSLVKSITVLVFSTIFFSTDLSAQQDAMYSMYMFNGLAVNPAYAGSRERVSFTALYRNQWTGLEGAPNTAVVVGHAPLANDNVGLGLSVVSDNISIFNRMSITANYAYRIKTRRGKLSLGASATFNNYRARWNELTLNDTDDRALTTNPNNVMTPNFGLGVYYYSEKFYAGISVPQLLNSSLTDNFKLAKDEVSAKEYRHYFATMGTIFKLSDNIKFKPSVLFKYVKNAPFQADINAAILMKEALWFGASYRTGDAVSVMVEYMFSKKLRVGYGYDITLSELNNYSSGTHEIMVGFEFGKQESYLTPRRMSYF